MKGNIFDIQPFSLHDGPGIRTTVFLKGCSLHCAWCSNPESQSKKPTLSYTKSKCCSSFTCTTVCPTNALLAINESLEIDRNACNACGKCVEVCPTNALKLYGYELSVAQILDKVKKDRAYFEKSGGGITLSGGEAMLQSKFVLELLQKVKKENIHTCLETSGQTALKNMKAVLPFVDLFLFDYKISDEKEHQKYTGSSNKKILENLGFLNENHAEITLRCPIIPGINDTEIHFKAINEISQKFRQIKKIELMAYHNWGQHKYEQIGLPLPKINSESVSDEEVEKWLAFFYKLGCTTISRG